MNHTKPAPTENCFGSHRYQIASDDPLRDPAENWHPSALWSARITTNHAAA